MIFSPKISSFGIDLSDLSIKIAKIKERRGKFYLTSFGRQEIPEGLIEEGEIQKEEELIDVIKKAVKEVKGEPLKTKYCVTSLPETESFIRMVSLPYLKSEEMAEAIKWELEANIPLSLNEIYYDWQIIESSPEKKQSEVLIGVLPKKTVDPYLSVLKKVGLRPIAFEIESIATARALIKNDYSEKPILIIDFGGKRCSIFVFFKKTIYFTTSLGVCNTSLVKILSKALDISEKKALAIKMKVGLDLAHPKGKIFNALQAPILEVVEKIKIFSSFFEEHYLNKNPENQSIKDIILCGGGALIAGLPEFLASELKMNVAIGDPWTNFGEDPSQAAGKFNPKESFSFTTALGLALRSSHQLKK